MTQFVYIITLIIIIVGFLAAADALLENFKNNEEIINTIQRMQLLRKPVANKVLANDMPLQLK